MSQTSIQQQALTLGLSGNELKRRQGLKRSLNAFHSAKRAVTSAKPEHHATPMAPETAFAEAAE